MKAIMLMFDSLNRRMLSPYGCDWTITPNFQRLQEHTVCFDTCYAGSLPCIPARRELHTGRFNFLHRSWGPLEPFDDSMPEILKNQGICSCLISDHMHYWEDGGATYHTRYSAWQSVRGQEGDPWMVTPELLQGAYLPQNRDGVYFQITGKMHCQDQANRTFIRDEAESPLAKTVSAGIDFVERNHGEDNWFLQIECFDPHEPFSVPDQYKALYPDEYRGSLYDWPPYHPVTEDEKTAKHLKMQYAALLTMCDAYLGKILDTMDAYDLWKDTLLIVNTDHGYLLGEHGWWSKGCMPWYDELVHLPLFIHDPRFCSQDGTRRTQIVQTIDIAPTILEFFGIPVPKDMQGKAVSRVINGNENIHEYAMFGVHGGHINIFDGRYVYMKAPVSIQNQPLSEYTLMPTHMRNRFTPGEFANTVLHDGFSFTKGCPVIKVDKVSAMGQEGFGDILLDRNNAANKNIDNNSFISAVSFGDKLFDMDSDPEQKNSLENPAIRAYMANLMIRGMRENDAPVEQYQRMGFPETHEVTVKDVLNWETLAADNKEPDILSEHEWTGEACNAYHALLCFCKTEYRESAKKRIQETLQNADKITAKLILRMIPELFDEEFCDMIYYFASLASRDF